MQVRVHYPAGADRTLALRTDQDWESDIDPASSDEARSVFGFDVRSTRRYTYFKPVLRERGETLWAQGENLLAIDGEPGGSIDVYPHFLGDNSCSVCTRHEVPSSLLEQTHAVRVFLPPGYAENTLERYPVIYMQDGQNLFFPEESFGGRHWRIRETLQRLDAMNLTRRVIVVGIQPRDRMLEYTAPGYETYGRFLALELKPWVDATYRTLSDARHTSVMGSSLGGVVSFYLAWQWPGSFGAAACLSSTFGWRDDLLERVSVEPRRDVRLYLDSGWPEDNYERTRAMRAALLDRGYEEGRDLLYFAFPEARHDETHWAMRAHIPFQFFHSRRAAWPSGAPNP